MKRPSSDTQSVNTDDSYSQCSTTGEGLASSARLSEDGRITIDLSLAFDLPDLPSGYALDVDEFATDNAHYASPPRMNIVIMIVGSRGDVQPFIALGKKLLEDQHRVRIATHETFRSFVKEHGLEFFNIGGDPEELMSYMVKNPGLMPGFASVVNGDIGRKRKMLNEMIDGCWRACREADEETGKTFAADAIISNPPAFAHVHCAEALGIPLTLSFTMPWCATSSFPHPLVNVKRSNAKPGLTNYLSYALTEMLTWQGLGDLIDTFRTKIGLKALGFARGPGITDELKIPWTYCMSPALVPKPKDWKNHIDLVGFYFLDQTSSYSPPADLANFLSQSPPPIYFGFGSIVMEDPKTMSEVILEAVKNTGSRALISSGWAELCKDLEIPDNVFILGNVPHDWLFDKVSAVCHHGGAGTTAIGLRMGKPTIIVPFFGDQPFWGDMIYKAGAGPEPIRRSEFTVERLTEAIKFTTDPAAQEAAQKMAKQIQAEDGLSNGVLSFYRHLPLLNMRCDLDPTRVAVWWSSEHALRLSSFVAQLLADEKLIDMNELELHRSKEYGRAAKAKAASSGRPAETQDPRSDGSSAMLWSITHHYPAFLKNYLLRSKRILQSAASIPRNIADAAASAHESVYYMSQACGSNGRPVGEIDGLASGIREGGKSLFFANYDAVTGIFMEPFRGGKKEGVSGVVKGSLRAMRNVSTLPLLGTAGFLAAPLRGMVFGTAKLFQKQRPQVQRVNRIIDGLKEAKECTEEERQKIIKLFQIAKETEVERKATYAAMAAETLDDMQEDLEDSGTNAPRSPTISSTSSSLSIPTRDHSNDVSTPIQRVEPRDEEAEDTRFVQEMERARQLSLEDM